MADTKRLHFGSQVRAIRRQQGLTQKQLADRVGVSASYINLIEHNRRPLPASLLVRLSQLFGVSLDAFAGSDEGALNERLMEALAEPLFDDFRLTNKEVQEFVLHHPTVARSFLALFEAYRGARAPEAQPGALLGRTLPSEEVSEFIQGRRNHFPELEEAADSLRRAASLSQQGELFPTLVRYLEDVHGIRTRIERDEKMEQAVRRLDRKRHKLRLSEILAPRSRNFQLAHQLALLEQAPLLDRLASDGRLTTKESRALCRIALANYFAAAVMMPYGEFLRDAIALRYDVELLGHRFRTSFEQVCHRLTTLQRPGAEGVPFHMVRLDIAGNISKRFSGSGFRFARFSGACPLWNEHTAFLTPGMVRVSVSALPDGRAYFCIARTVRDNRGGYRAPHAMHSVGIGCELRHARALVYSEGMDLERAAATATPIGVSCGVCERSDCEQRAFPAVLRPMRIVEDVRGKSFYASVSEGDGGTTP